MPINPEDIELEEVPRIKRLTRKQLKVLKCIASGMRVYDIAKYLHIGVKAVYKRSARIRANLLANSNTQAVVIAYKEGILK